jgi:microcystin-dependent protein
VSIQAGSISADVTFTLPTADGSANQVLKTDGSGILSWTSNASSTNDLSDVLIESNSLYLGNDPSSTTDNAQYNVAFGATALDAITTGDGNAAFGHNSLTANTSGAYNVGIGNSTLAANTSGVSNLAIGHVALGSNTTGNYNVGVGHSALNGNTTGARNTALGYGALDYPDTENDNIAIGYDALGGAINGGEMNVAIGNYSLDANTTGDNNTAVGYNSLTSSTTATFNTAFGSSSLSANTTGRENTATGGKALTLNTTGNYNTATGFNALAANTTAEFNTATGNWAMGNTTTGGGNTGTGNKALMVNTTGASNTSIGYGSLQSNTTGSNNTALGQSAGDVITTGTNNVILGSGSDPSANSGTNQIVIGYNASGHGDNIAVIGNTDMTALHPADDNGVDLGSSSYEYKNLYVDGVAYLDAIGMGSTAMTLPTADGSSDQVLKTNGSGTLSWTTVSGSPSGSITMYGGSSAPTDWLLCGGAAVSRSTYSALFSVIGTTYGAGDGSSTFNLPDFGGKGPMGYKSDNSKFDALAETSGEETHTLTTDEMPAHTHTLRRITGGSSTDSGYSYGTSTYSSHDNPSIASTGGGSAHDVLDPYLTVNFIIKI